MKIRMPLYVFLYLHLRQIPSIRKAQRQYALLPHFPCRKSQKPEVISPSGKFKKTRPYHGNIDGLCRRRYPSLYKEKKREDRTENKSRNFQESISEKQSRNKECCRASFCILAFFQKLLRRKFNQRYVLLPYPLRQKFKKPEVRYAVRVIGETLPCKITIPESRYLKKPIPERRVQLVLWSNYSCDQKHLSAKKMALKNPVNMRLRGRQFRHG